MQKYSLHINFVHKVCRIIDYGNLFCPLSGKEKRNCFIWSLCVSDDWVFVNNVFPGTNGVLVNPPFLPTECSIYYLPIMMCMCVCASLIKYVMSFHPSKMREHLWLFWTNFCRQSRTNRGVVWLLLNRTSPKTRECLFAWHIC